MLCFIIIKNRICAFIYTRKVKNIFISEQIFKIIQIAPVKILLIIHGTYNYTIVCAMLVKFLLYSLKIFFLRSFYALCSKSFFMLISSIENALHFFIIPVAGLLYLLFQ